MGVGVVWFKRDLRVADHAPLRQACDDGPVVCLYVVEPGLWAQADHDPAHLDFVAGCLADLDDALRARGNRLLIRTGRVRDVLADLRARGLLDRLYSHEETGTAWTFARDKAVARWCAAQGVPWTERPASGVQRPHPERDGWARRWDRRLHRPPVPAPAHVAAPTWPAGLVFEPIPSPRTVGLAPSRRTEAQPGGRVAGLALVDSFLAARGVDYRRGMSSPVRAWTEGSRLSPYLAWGALSAREVVHATRARADAVRDAVACGDAVDAGWLASLEAFEARLRWRDHFTQKLEDDPSIEHSNLSPAVDGLRVETTDRWTERKHAAFAAWRDGRTGYPMVDACMRCLDRTGWINFRMRAMLVSFATYDLWLHWRPVALELARRFVDFDPGIHYPQVQMQAGTTGINALRIYDPVKQQVDHDPDGVFVRHWVPELARVPLHLLHRPHRMDPSTQVTAGCRVGEHYPSPIVDHALAAAAAARRLDAVRATAEARDQARAIHHRHGSRRGPRRR